MKRLLSLLFVLALLCSFSSVLHAATITYETHDLGSGRWEYVYEVKNDTLSEPINEFTVYFDYGLYADLFIDSPKAGWDGMTVEPDLALGVPVPGYYDALALVSGIAPGASEGGFQVSFTWLGQGTPGPQSFDIVNPDTFETIESGRTTGPAPVPEPGMMILLSMGIVGIAGMGRRKS